MSDETIYPVYVFLMKYFYWTIYPVYVILIEYFYVTIYPVYVFPIEYFYVKNYAVYVILIECFVKLLSLHRKLKIVRNRLKISVKTVLLWCNIQVIFSIIFFFC